MEDPKLRELVQNVLRHFTFVDVTDQNDNALQLVTMDVDKLTAYTRKVYPRKSELNSLCLDVYLLDQYMKNPNNTILFKPRKSAAELRKAK